MAVHRDADGELLTGRVTAELLNILRPRVAVCWFAAFARPAPLAGQPRQAGQDDTAFAQEVRRFYPFAPFVGGNAATDLTSAGEPIPAGTLALLDLYGHNHDADLWSDPYRIRPERFLNSPADPQKLIPQRPRRRGHRPPLP